MLVPTCPSCGEQWIGRTEAAALDAARTNAPEVEGILDGLRTELKRRAEALDAVDGLPEETLAELVWLHREADALGEGVPQWQARARFTGAMLPHFPALVAEIRRARAQVAAGGGTGPEVAVMKVQGQGPCLCDHAENKRKAHAVDCPARKPRRDCAPAAEPKKGGGRP